MDKLICQKCGGEISNEFNNTLLFCTNCGASLNLAESEKTLSLPDSEALLSAAPRPDKAKTNRASLYLIGGLGLLGVIVLAAAPFFFYGLPIVNKQYTCSIPGEPEPQTSEEYFERAKKHVEIFTGNGGTSFDDCAIGALSEVIRLDSGHAEALEFRGRAYLQREQFDLALADYDKAIQIKPDYADLYYFRSRVYAGQKQFDKAVEDITKAIELAPKEDGKSLEKFNQTIDEYYSKQGNFDKLIERITQKIESTPKDDKLLGFHYHQRGNYYFDKGDYAAAVRDFTEAIRLEPDYPQSYNGRAAAYRQLGKNEPADEDERKSEELRAANN